MIFLHPILLGIGAACVAIPVVIHLLMRRRRKPVRWAAMRFLLEAYKQRQRRVRLEQLLLLAARCLLIVLIALAIGRPMLGRSGGLGSGARDVYLLVDTSLGSAIVGEGGESALSVSVERALDLLDRLESTRGDRVALITLGGVADAVVLPPTRDLALIERRLLGLQPTDSPMDLLGGLAFVPAAAADGERESPMVAVFSAFREGSVGQALTLGVLQSGVTLFAEPPSDEPLGNVGLLGLDLLRPVVVSGGGDNLAIGAAQVRARLVRSGVGFDEGAVSSVRVFAVHEGTPREIGSAEVRWAPGQTEAQSTIDIDLAGLGAAGRVVLRGEIDRDANERDNTAWAVLDVREQLRVAVLGTRRFGALPRIMEFVPSDWVRLALEPVGGLSRRSGGAQIEVEVLDVSRFEKGELVGFDAVIVTEPDRVRPDGWAGLGEFHARGGAVVLTASATPGVQLWTETATSALDVAWTFDREPSAVDSQFRGLTAPPVEGDDLLWYLRGELAGLAETVLIERTLGVDVGEGGGVLLATTDSTPVLVVSNAEAGAGLVVLLTTAIDLQWTDLPARPLMVPLLQEIVRSGVGRGPMRQTVTAGARVAVPMGAVEVVDRAGAEQRAVPVDPSTGLTRTAIRLGGAYAARDAGGVEIGAVTIQPAADAGRAGAVNRDRIEAWLGAAVGGGARFAWSDAAAFGEGSEEGERTQDDPGPGLMLFVGALVLACFEVWLARRVSHAARTVGGVGASGGVPA